MFAPPGTGRLGPNAPRACAMSRALPRGFASRPSPSPVSKGRSADSRERDPRSLAQRGCVSTFQRFNVSTLQPPTGFTLLELLIVIGIIGLLLVLIARHSQPSKMGGVSPTPRTRSKACSTPRAPTRKPTTPTLGSGFTKRTSRIPHHRTQIRQPSEGSSSQSSRQRMAQCSTPGT